MSRQLKRAAHLGFAAITVEGGLISPERLSTVASATPDQKTAADYGCPKGTTLRDEITRYFRIAQAHWQGYARIAAPTKAQTEAFVKSLLEQAFGFQLSGPHIHTQDARRFHVAWEAKQGRVPVVVAAPITAEKGKLGEGFARAQPEFGDGPNGRIPKRSPAVLLQDWLNTNEASLWGLVFAGDRLRLMRDNASLTRPAYIEADLGAILRDEMFSDFTLLWLLIHASRFGAEGAPSSESALESWREAGMKAGTAARERLRANVEDALLSLGQGLLDANLQLRQRLDDQSLPMPHLFEQLLRVVYRLIFLAVAEDRELLHPKGTTRATAQLYADNYSFAYLRDRSLRRNAHDHHLDAWEGLKIVFNALASGAPLLGLPALGGLFGAGLTPDLDSAQMPNRALMAAIYKLGWLDNAGPRVRINWRDMATEELGSVYEGLLELVAIREEGGRKFSFAGGAEARGNARKTSGSYYTPDSLVQCLLDSALNPVLEHAEAEGGVDAILDLNVIDPACGSGHFLLGAARRMATRVAQLRDPDAPDYNAAMRDVVRNCIHGVDRNSMAIELAKVALWIETVEPGKPLGFLDANLQCGDSLLGIFDLKVLEEGIPDDAYKVLTGDDKETAKHFAKRNKAEKVGQGLLDFGTGGSMMPPARLAAQMDELRHLPEDTVAQVEAKRKKFSTWTNDPARYSTKLACDLYTSAFLVPKVGGVPGSAGEAMIPTTAHVRTRLAGGQIHSQLEGEAVDAAMSALAFHWPLAFPEVMISKGGFDVILGNPPWERAKLQEIEFFTSRAPEIVNAATASKRKAMIAALERAPKDSSDKNLFLAYQREKHTADAAIVFFRSSGRFPHSARGDLNTYTLFTEFGVNALSHRGKLGILVPSGIATESATSALFGYLSENGLIQSFFDFENRGGFFHGLHTKHKFAAFCLSRQKVDKINLCFFASSTADLQDPRKRIELNSEDILIFNPNTKTLPILRSNNDLSLLKKLHINGRPLVKREGNNNPWEVDFLRMFDMTIDSGLFHDSFSDEFCPLYEAKMFWHFDHRWANASELAEGYISSSIKNDPTSFANPRYYVDQKEVATRLNTRNWYQKWMIAYRNVSDSRNERTFVSTIIPRCGVGNSATVLTISEKFIAKTACLLANMNSLVFDYAVRQKVPAMNVNVFMVDQFPILAPGQFSEADVAFINSRVIELVFTSNQMTPFANDLGFTCGPYGWNEDRRAQLRAELDAWYALAYGLSRDELRYILNPKDVMGPDYPSETFRVLQSREEKEFGEYRTRRLVLAACDKLVTEGMRPRIEDYR